MNTKTFLLTITMFLLTSLAIAQHKVYLKNPNSIPLYYQETDHWCGAASAQMILQGYPNGIEHPYQQKTVWNTIQKHKVEKNWATDPVGLIKTLNELGQGTSWDIFYWKGGDTPAANLMYWVAYWMTKKRFPAGATVYGHGHALIITGITTDVNPLSSKKVVLQNIELHDPWPWGSGGGTYVYTTGSQWFYKYWNRPGYGNSKWSGCFLAYLAFDPSVANIKKKPLGIVTAPKVKIRGKVLASHMIKRLTRSTLAKLQLPTRDIYKNISKLTPFTPILVNENEGGYYLIPLGDPVTGLSSAAVLLNAYDGSFESLGVFGNSLRYADSDSVEEKITKHLKRHKIKEIKAVFRFTQQLRSPFYPAWKITLSENRSPMFYLPDGKIVNELTPLLK